MTESIGRGDYELHADLSGLKRELGQADQAIAGSGKAAETAYTESGTRAGRAFGTAVGGGVKVMGAAATAGFALATKGAIDLTNVTAKYRQETGASAEEATKAGKAINRIAGDNMQSLESVGDVLGKVHTDLGLTGDAAEDSANRFVRFSRATGQDAAGAVSAFDDILDGFGLTAEDAQGIMDKLVVSHQKYGGSITDNQAALSAMAPQLKALNLNVDDGIGLLNLFASSGLDAATGQKALNAAIKNLPPGTSLNDFIAQLSQIEDPAERAAKASEVFGGRAGPQLANAIKPGVSAIKDFEVSAGDAAGATDKAVQAMDSTPVAIFQKAMSQAGAAVRGFGAELGPAATGILSLASLAGTLGFDKVFSGALDVARGSPAVSAAATALGSTTGTLISTATRVAIAAAPIVAVVAIAFAADQIHNQVEDLGVQIHDAIGIPKFDIDPGSWPWPIGNKGAPDWARFSEDAKAGTDRIIQGMVDEAGAQSPQLKAQWDRMGEGATSAMAKALPAASATAGAAVTTFAKTTEVQSGHVRDDVGSMSGAFKGFGDDLRTLANDAISSYFGPIKQQDRLLAIAHEEAQARATRASKTATREEKDAATAQLHNLQAERLSIMADLAVAGRLSAGQSRSLMKDLQAAYRNATGDAKAKIGDLIAKIRNLPTSHSTTISTPGLTTAASRLNALWSRLNSLPTTKTVSVNVRVTNPAGVRNLDLLRQHGGPVDFGNLYRVGERGEEWFIPWRSGVIVPNDVVRSIRQMISQASTSQTFAPLIGSSGGGGTSRVEIAGRIGIGLDAGSLAALRAAGYNEGAVAGLVARSVDAGALTSNLAHVVAMRTSGR